MKNLSLAFVALLSLTAIGCKKQQKAGGADCAAAINHSMSLSKAEMEKMGADAKMMQQMVDLGVKRCTEDKWSPEVLKCMTDAKAMADAQACYGKLTPEQQQKMNQAAMEMGKGPHEEGAAGSAAEGSAAEGAGSAMGSDSGSAGSAAAPADTAGSAGSAGSAAAPN
jgi:hypothetical protein